MGWLSRWLNGEPLVSEPERDVFAEVEAQMRAEDPDYDAKQAAHRENVRLRERRDFLRQREENVVLRQEIAELEMRAEQRRQGDSGVAR